MFKSTQFYKLATQACDIPILVPTKHLLTQRVRWCCVTEAADYVDNESEAWLIREYGPLDNMKRETVKMPIITEPDQVLVKIHAASVNPLDVSMIGGYGATVLNMLRKFEKCSNMKTEFPLCPGRDFAGVVVSKGLNTRKLNLGDEVWGVLPPSVQGCHAKHVVASISLVEKKPPHLTMQEAASMLFVGMTAWCAIQATGGFAVRGGAGKKALVLGGSGGVGTMAIQLLHAWGASVTTTAKTDAIEWLKTLGVFNAIDYTKEDLHAQLEQTSKYDLILDCAGLGVEEGQEYLKHLNDEPMSRFVTLKSSLLNEIEAKGVVEGFTSSLTNLVLANLQPAVLPRLWPIRWGFFFPLPMAFKEINSLTLCNKLKPHIDTILPFEKAQDAYCKVAQGGLRGKVVLEMVKE